MLILYDCMVLSSYEYKLLGSVHERIFNLKQHLSISHVHPQPQNPIQIDNSYNRQIGKPHITRNLIYDLVRYSSHLTLGPRPTVVIICLYLVLSFQSGSHPSIVVDS